MSYFYFLHFYANCLCCCWWMWAQTERVVFCWNEKSPKDGKGLYVLPRQLQGVHQGLLNAGTCTNLMSQPCLVDCVWVIVLCTILGALEVGAVRCTWTVAWGSLGWQGGLKTMSLKKKKKKREAMRGRERVFMSPVSDDLVDCMAHRLLSFSFPHSCPLKFLNHSGKASDADVGIHVWTVSIDKHLQVWLYKYFMPFSINVKSFFFPWMLRVNRFHAVLSIHAHENRDFWWNEWLLSLSCGCFCTMCMTGRHSHHFWREIQTHMF